MYRFDDKWRKRLLEDALVAELLGSALETAPSGSAAGAKDAPSAVGESQRRNARASPEAPGGSAPHRGRRVTWKVG